MRRDEVAVHVVVPDQEALAVEGHDLFLIWALAGMHICQKNVDICVEFYIRVGFNGLVLMMRAMSSWKVLGAVRG